MRVLCVTIVIEVGSWPGDYAVAMPFNEEAELHGDRLVVYVINLLQDLRHYHERLLNAAL